MVVMNRADVVALINAINAAAAKKTVFLEMQLDPDLPIDETVETPYGLVTLRWSIPSYGGAQFTIFSDDPEVAQSLKSLYANLRNEPGGGHKKSDRSQLRYEESTDGVFAIFHGLRPRCYYYTTVRLPR